MPLLEGYGDKTVGKNISKEVHSGMGQRQAIAVALSKSRESQRRRKMWEGGEVGGDDNKEADLEYHKDYEPPHTSGTPDEQELDFYEALRKRRNHWQGGYE